MAPCPACGHENPPETNFCPECGTRLAPAPPSRAERKVVTVLFADLVGFTARAEQLDPEDVRSVLAPYHARLRTELERFGGTVEKFIGDAVMALFGAPTAHEDDPERAVRAALAIRDWARNEGDIQVRIGANTGEALIDLGASAAAGEGMAAGDVVNTAARLQSAAAVNGVLVGEATYRATADVVDYREAGPIEAKGKVEPVPAWEALEPRARVGTEAVSTRTQLVGRRREVDQLVDAFERARQEPATLLVTLVGVPGIGKSRLVAELLSHVEAIPEPCYWRHGRSLPYGEGVTFWALAEMVKAQAGILESDPAAEVERKLREAVERTVPESERRWVETKLRPLVGLAGAGELGERAEAFSAWRRFFETLAEHSPLVLVFEDLHWAGDELLDFVDELPDWVEDVPLLVLCTTRPELLDRRPGWGGGKRNATTISLGPLDATETAQLIGALLERSVLPAETQSELLARSGGNPLYAEQFARMLSERGDVGDELPATVQGIIAARIDLLADDEKRLLQDAAVVGKVFWTGSLAAMSGSEPADVEQRLRSLGRKEFVRRERRSSVDGQAEHAFNHVLVRDVAYAQIPRTQRADRHRRAADWIESLGRAEDQAELLAHHYLSALELVQATGGETDDLAPRARAALRAAGARALALQAYAAAARWFEAAAGLRGDPDPDRPRALLQHALALHALGDPDRAERLEEARGALIAVGDVDGAAEADLALAELWSWAGESERCAASLERAADAVRETGTRAARASVLSQIARFRFLFGEKEAAIAAADESMRLAEELGRDDLRSKNLVTLGSIHFHLPGFDSEAALAEIRAGGEIAAGCGDLSQLTRSYNNLGSLLGALGDLAGARSAMRENQDLARRRGHVPGMRFAAGNMIDLDLECGNWEEAERRARDFLEASKREPHYQDTSALIALALIELARDRPDAARANGRLALEAARKVGDPQVVVPTVARCAFLHAELGEAAHATALLRELEPGPDLGPTPGAFFAAARLGLEDELWSKAAGSFVEASRWEEAAAAVVEGRWSEAAHAYERIGARPFAALAALHAAEAHTAAGRRAEAAGELARSLEFWRSVGARRYLREGEALLASSA